MFFKNLKPCLWLKDITLGNLSKKVNIDFLQIHAEGYLLHYTLYEQNRTNQNDQLMMIY